jgi:hypothetical protein
MKLGAQSVVRIGRRRTVESKNADFVTSGKLTGEIQAPNLASSIERQKSARLNPEYFHN